ncbi:MATE family efflux transporter [Thalassococcus sp. S3]|uniref:MATE family efflux transporter n=1 Tax=Thalassococcus sp. S3 TaxID=2017482 RepID=UPI001024517C|nr:MATE family efflux transporter [Thalassococcus sp. S3]QBF33379.1 MATE family efflux transporter [Thalassococcus sp. S3]
MAQRNLTEGRVWRALAHVSAPMSLGILAVLSVGIADAYFLGQLGSAPLAAVGFIYPITTALASLAIGLSAGANAAISQALGREDEPRDIYRLGFHALGLGLALAVLVAGFVTLTYSVIFGAMGAGDAVMTEIAAYMPLWALSFPFLVLLMITNAVFRAYGDAAYASIFMIVAALANIALNPLLIFGAFGFDGLGTEGAAAATLIGRVLAAAAGLYFAFRLGYLKRCGRLLEGARKSLSQIIPIGAPAAFSNAINPAGMALVTAAVATLGETAVAGFGAATRVQSVAIVVLLALSAGIGPVVGQNWGAEKRDRAQAAVIQSWLFCVAYGTLLALVLFVFSGPIASLIASDEDAASYTADYLQIVGLSLFGYGVLVTANAAMNARSKAVYSMSLSVARIFAIYLPLAWLGVLTFGYMGILGAAVIANVAGAAGAFYLCRRAGLLPERKDLRSVAVA